MYGEYDRSGVWMCLPVKTILNFEIVVKSIVYAYDCLGWNLNKFREYACVQI